MLDNGDIAFNDVLIHIGILGVEFYGVVLSRAVNVIDSCVEQVTLRRSDFTDAPIITAYIVVGDKVTVLIGCISVYESFTLIYTVHSAAESGIALSLAISSAQFLNHFIGITVNQLYGNTTTAILVGKFGVKLIYIGSPLLQNVLKGFLSHFVPLNDCTLTFRNDIADRGIYFFNSEVRADKNILESGNTVLVGSCILIDFNSAERSAVQMELESFNELIFGSLNHLEIATLQDVLKGFVYYLVPFDFNGLCFGNDILFCGVYFLKGITRTNEYIFKHRNTVFIGNCVFVYLMTAERSTIEVELNALNHIIFGSLYDFEIATLEFVIKVVLGNFFPFDNRNLTVRNDISFCGFDFFKGIVSAYKHILEHSHTAFIGSGEKVNGLS